MGGINVGRWLAGGIVAAIVIFVLEGLIGQLYMERMVSELEAHGLSMEPTTGTILMAAILCLLTGLVLVFFYAAARPRFGAGVKTAVIVAVVFYFGSMIPTILGYRMLGLYSDGLLGVWAIQGLVEWVLASIAGAWVYREESIRTGTAGATAR